jgi:hypothetical protein
VSKLYNSIVGGCPNGLSYSDAVQLFLLLYCRLDFVPEGLKNEIIDEKTLVDTFSRLDAEGLIYDGEGASWSSLVKRFLLKEVDVDPVFESRARSYLIEPVAEP